MVNSLFFQAEDGIRARDVTGVQTCALPISEGYGRNFLLPRKLAIEASEGNKAVIAQMKAASVRRSAKEKAQAEELATQFDGVSVTFQRHSGEHDQRFGSVTSSDIGDALTNKE